MLLVNTTGEIADIIAPAGIVQPPWWNIGLFYIFFFGMLGFNSVSKRQICLFGTLIVFFVWQFPNTASTPEILVINHGYNHPPLVAVSFPGSQSAFIIDVPDKATGALAGKILRSKGVRNAEVMFSSNTTRSSAGIPALSSFLDITVRNPPGNSKFTEAFLRNIEHPGVKITDVPASFSAELISRDSIRMKNIFGCDIKTSAVNSGRSIEITTPQGEIIRETVPWCSLPTAWLYKVKPAD